MSAKMFLPIFLIAAGVQFAPAFSAETDGRDGRRHGRHARILANLSQEERTKLRAAHQQAMADPAVQAAKDRQRRAAQEFRELKRAAMLRADPTIVPILEKIPARGRGDS